MKAGSAKQLEMKAVTEHRRRRRKKRRRRQASEGAERPKAARGNVRHRPRPDHKERFPVHVTMRAAKGLPSFRAERVRKLFEVALKRQARRDYGPCFRVCHFSIQDTHVHLIVEAEPPTPEILAQAKERGTRSLVSKRAKKGLETLDRDMLRRGIAGFMISIAKQLNALLEREGAVWGDRHHRRELESPGDVRNTLVYVLQNHRHHGLSDSNRTLDPFSSAPWFSGWKDAPKIIGLATVTWIPPPRTWLLTKGWQQRDGLLSVEASPRQPS